MQKDKIYYSSKIAESTFFRIPYYGFYTKDSSYIIKRSNYGTFLLLMSLSGMGSLEYNQMLYSIKPGQICLIDTNISHEIRTLGKEKWSFCFIHFNGPSAKAYVDLIHQECGISFSPHYFDEIISEFDKLDELTDRNDINIEAQISLLVTKILTLLLESPSEKWYFDVIEYIKNNFSDKIELDTLANISGMSRSYFIKKFKANSGVSPYHYLLRYRVECSKQIMLQSPHLSITTISLKCGFESVSGFCQGFSSITGITPSEFKQKYAEESSAY